MADIISEGHRQCTIDALMRGEADDKSVQVAIASLLISVTKLSDRVETMDKNMWKRDDLADFVDRRHRERCDDCPAKRYVDRMQVPVVQTDKQDDHGKRKSWISEILLSEPLRYFILVLILVWTVVTMRTTSEESTAIMEKVQTTLSGGMK